MKREDNQEGRTPNREEDKRTSGGSRNDRGEQSAASGTERDREKDTKTGTGVDPDRDMNSDTEERTTKTDQPRSR